MKNKEQREIDKILRRVIINIYFISADRPTKFVYANKGNILYRK